MKEIIVKYYQSSYNVYKISGAYYSFHNETENDLFEKVLVQNCEWNIIKDKKFYNIFEILDYEVNNENNK